MRSIGCLLFILFANISFGQTSGKILVAAASDLKFALDSVVASFQNKYPEAKVDVTYGSSGKLTEQILRNAPFDIFFSADVMYPRQLKDKKLTASEIIPYGKGRIVLWSKRIDPCVKGMNSITDAAIRKLAIANPLHAPYGKRAEESLKHYKLLASVSSKLVYGENISQTAQYATTGAADAAIIALSLAMSPAMKSEGGKYFLIPEDSHQPLEQAFVILRHGRDNRVAAAFRDYMMTDASQGILSYFGFTELKK